LKGGSGDDRLYGTAARDVISGGSGDDLIVGADGDDSLTGDEGRDRVDGGPGNDRLDGAEWPHYQSPDTLDCGDGFDYLSLDEYDSQTGCENGSYPMGPGQGWSSQAPPGTRPPGWMPPLPPAQPLPVIAPKARLVRHAIRLGARCRADEPADCLGRIKLVRAGDHGGRVLGAGSFHLAPGRKATVKVGLTAYGVRAARAHRVLRATAVVTARGGSARRRSAVILRSAEAPARRR
jgi:Ca2+-binding RTX toxin-like protein